MKISEKKLQNLQDIINIQCSNGNYDCNSYMLGLANGLLLAKSILTGEDPNYLDAPKKWLDDYEISEADKLECVINE